MKLEFRALRADEIDVRIGTVKEGKGVSLLLYKDARCDMNILDETVGAENWQKCYCRENANCIVSIWDDDKKQWVGKEDTGTESNTEKEKGLASDSFKRARFNWGIGRELYTATFIWIPGAEKTDKFWVSRMEVENHKITKLAIGKCDQWGNPMNEDVFTWPRTYQKPAPATNEQKADELAKVKAVAAAVNKPAGLSDKEIMAIEALMERKGVTLEQISRRYGVKSIGELTSKQYVSCLGALNATPDKGVSA